MSSRTDSELKVDSRKRKWIESELAKEIVNSGPIREKLMEP